MGVVSFMHQSFHAQGRIPQCRLDKRPQSRSGRGGEDKTIPASAGKQTPVMQPVAWLLYWLRATSAHSEIFRVAPGCILNTKSAPIFFQSFCFLQYEGVSKSFRTGRLEREMQMAQLSATRSNCITILWVSLVSFAAITLCVASERVFVVVVVYFVIDSDRKLLDISSYTHTHTHTHTQTHTCIHTYIYTYMHAYIQTYIHTYIHTYEHTYIHTHIHTLHYITLHYIILHYIGLLHKIRPNFLEASQQFSFLQGRIVSPHAQPPSQRTRPLYLYPPDAITGPKIILCFFPLNWILKRSYQ
jgi:hypothetical protein